MAVAQSNGKRSAKGKLASDAGNSDTSTMTPTSGGEKAHDVIDARAELTRTISELNEVQMRLDAIVRRLAESVGEVEGAGEAAAEMTALRLRLLGKLDRIRDELVVRLGEERRANVH